MEYSRVVRLRTTLSPHPGRVSGRPKQHDNLVHLPRLVACKAPATNPTVQLPKRPHPPAKFHYSSWQERSPHPQPGLNKHPSDITSCQLQNSPGLPTSDHKVPGHAGPSGRDVQPVAPFTHTQATKAEASEQEGAPTPTSARQPGPSLPAPLLGGSRASCPSASPSPSANPMERRRGQPAGGLQPDPDTPPLTLLQELQTQSHEGQSGVRDPETGRDRKWERERQGSREHGRQGAGAEKARGPRALGKGTGSKGGLQHKSH